MVPVSILMNHCDCVHVSFNLSHCSSKQVSNKPYNWTWDNCTKNFYNENHMWGLLTHSITKTGKTTLQEGSVGCNLLTTRKYHRAVYAGFMYSRNVCQNHFFCFNRWVTLYTPKILSELLLYRSKRHHAKWSSGSNYADSEALDQASQSQSDLEICCLLISQWLSIY